MLDVFKMRVMHIVEHILINGIRSFFKENIYINRKAIIVEKNLFDVKERLKPLQQTSMQVVELSEEFIKTTRCTFAFKHRALKAEHYLQKGFGGHALIHDNVVVGEIWYYSAKSIQDPRLLHKDLQWLGIKNWADEYIYSFDIFIAPAARKNGVSATLQNNAMFDLSKKGFKKAFAYYWQDNIPAVWNTKVINRWVETNAVSVNRFFMFKRAIPIKR